MSKVVPLPGLLVVGGEYPPQLETRLAVLDVARQVVRSGFAAHVVDLAARNQSRPDSWGLDSEWYLSGLNPEGIVVVNPTEVQISPFFYPHYVSDATAHLALNVAMGSGSNGGQVFVSHEMPTGPGKSAELLKQAGARALQQKYAQLPRLLGEQ